MIRPATVIETPEASADRPTAVSPSRAITRPLSQEEIRRRDLMLAECRRIAENARRPVRGCK
jgi:hypothetical protein